MGHKIGRGNGHLTCVDFVIDCFPHRHLRPRHGGVEEEAEGAQRPVQKERLRAESG
jgi:hypothetical protein